MAALIKYRSKSSLSLAAKRFAAALLIAGQVVPTELRAGGNETTVQPVKIPQIPIIDRSQPYDLPEMWEAHDFTTKATTTRPRSINDVLEQNEAEMESRNLSFSEHELRKLLPKFIAQMEGAYPGLQYVFIGRDAKMIGRAVQAFYLSRGENDRVVFLDISEDIYKEMSETEKSLLLESNGFRITKKSGLSRPYIILDATDSERKSQSIGLRKVGNEMLLSTGADWSHIRSNFAVVNLSNAIPSQLPLPTTLSGLKAMLSNRTISEFDRTGVDIGLFSAGLDTLLRKQIIHGPHAVKKIDIGGHFGGQPTRFVKDPLERDEWISREQAEREIKVLAEIMSSPDIFKAVQQAAKDVGYEFPTPKLNNPDILTIADALKAAKETNPISRKKVLDFMTNARLTEQQYRDILSSITFTSNDYNTQVNDLLTKALTPTTIGLAELFIAYDGLLSIKQGKFMSTTDRSTRTATQTSLERHASNAMMATILYEILRQGPVIPTSFFQGIAEFLIDPAAQKETQDISKAIEQRFLAETPTFTEKVTRKMPLQWFKSAYQYEGGSKPVYNPSKAPSWAHGGVSGIGGFLGAMMTVGADAPIYLFDGNAYGIAAAIIGSAAAGASSRRVKTGIQSLLNARKQIRSDLAEGVSGDVSQSLAGKYDLTAKAIAVMCSRSTSPKN